MNSTDMENEYYDKNKTMIDGKVSKAMNSEIPHEFYSIMRKRIVSESEMWYFLQQIQYNCCTSSHSIGMSKEEALKIKSLIKDVNIRRFLNTPNWISTYPCPFHIRSKCTIYDDRPLSCRTYRFVEFEYDTNMFDVFKEVTCPKNG